MKMKTRFFACAVLVLLLNLILPMVASAGESFHWEGEELSWVMQGIPDKARVADFRTIVLKRGSDSGEPLYFQLSDLEDGAGNKFPRELIVVRTPYDSAEQRWDRSFSSKRLLAAKDEYVELEIGVYYHELVPAGNYIGKLYTDDGSSIPLEITVDCFTKVGIDPPEIKLEIDSGPGVYISDESVTVTVLANHEKWVMTLFSDGLFYEDEEEALRRSIFARSRELEIEPLTVFIVRDNKVIPLSSPLEVRADDCAGGHFNFKIQTEVGWEHKAGKYVGVIQVDLEFKD